jgi:dihydroorotate dehydrogenase
MDKKVSLFGMTLQSPFIIGSGPISYAAEGMIRAHAQGAGAVVTKTIRTLAAENPYPHIALSGRDSMINAEKWTDFPPERWIEQEIPQAKAAGVTVIASIGHTEQEAALWVGRASRAGADMIELVSYTEQTILPMVRTARTLTDKPILVKISPNWSDPVSAALQTLDCGADGITAMDSIGPVLRIDIRTRRPLVGGPGGSGWLTGGAIKPITLRYVAELAQRTDKPIIGLGGVMTAEDAAEMMMAGAAAVGICTAPMLKGIEYISKLCSGIEKLAGSLGFARAADMTGAALSSLGEKENMRRFSFAYSPEICIDCRKCVIVCPYQARELNERVMSLDTELCRFCGLCASVCPTSALRIVPAE